MTLEEAKDAANRGEKITHRFFDDEEYVTVKDGKLIDENNYYLGWDEFWMLRNTPVWQTDWEIYSSKNNQR